MARIPDEINMGSRSPDLESLTGNEVVISGISGLFPKSENVIQFMENLYNHVDMVEPIDPEISLKHRDMPNFVGKVKGYSKFDNQFFKVSHYQSEFMEPYNRKLMEQAYSVLFDAGINPASVSGRNVGVFIGYSFGDQTVSFIYSLTNQTRYMITGSSKTMLANRISYWLDGKAPSYALDENNASSTVCLEHAYWAIRNGLCNAAIVGGCSHIMLPSLSVNLRRAGLLTLDGKTKCFDKMGDGYVRSEACGTLFLQRAKDAKRIYCEVYYAKQKFFANPSGGITIVQRSEDLEKFFQEFYSEIDVSPDMVEYIEANGIGIAKADRNELKAIANVFAKNKTVKVGSVKSNMGHGEAASGFCSLVKICLANQTGKLPANLHYNEPHDDIPALKDGRIQIVTENLPLNKGYFALNSFSYGGANVHVLLKNYYKQKDDTKYRCSFPRLVLASARNASGVNKIIDYLKSKPIDPEEIALLHNFYSIDISGHTARGYVVLNTDKDEKTITSSQGDDLYYGIKKPVWFLYSGMGSQWKSMGASLMNIPVFSAAVERCRRVLEPKGVDIVRILTEPDETIFDNILNSFVGICAVQIGLTDILKELEIVPDNIIGHSVGELGCAYADGCFTVEEMILASYYRGLVSVEAELMRGAMAAVGLGYKDLLPLCPPEIDIACHNSSESCTISGPYEDIKKFVADLNSRGVFAREVNTANIAYHSRYIAQLGDKLRSKMKEFITTPKLRSKKWLATSVLPENWDTPEARYSSAEYFTNNLLSSVYFEEVATRIPPDAIVIEVAPHGLMQAILKRSHESCVHVPLTRRNHLDGPAFLLGAIGKLYLAGLQPKIEALYPKVRFPVSTETPILSHLVEWDHNEHWSAFSLNTYEAPCPSREITLSVHDDDWSHLKDHIRDGITVMPESAILILVWETLAKYQGIDYKKLTVHFKNVEFHGTINTLVEQLIKIKVCIMIGSGVFEVTWNQLLIATGHIYACNLENAHKYILEPKTQDCIMQLNSKDVYTIMNLRGHSYGPKMQSIVSCDIKFNKAQVKWYDDWMIFLDSLLQLGALANNHTDVVTPVYINSLFIDTVQHMNSLCDRKYYNALVMGDDGMKIIRCGAVEVKDIVYRRKPVIALNKDITLQNPDLKEINSETDEVKNSTEKIVLTSIELGDVDKLCWTKINDMQGSTPVQVCYAGISLRDWCTALGTVRESNSFGMDYSGINQRNERVMGVIHGGAMASSVDADLDLLWPVPEHWSLEDAATVPLPYLTVYYALTVRTQLLSNNTILIMNGASTLGQAFLSVCLDIGCTVLTTVSGLEEKRYLQKVFPKLREELILDRSATYIKSVISSDPTNLSPDIIVNYGPNKLTELHLQCVGNFGITLDIIEMPEYKVIGMDSLTNDRNVILVHVPNIFKFTNLKEKRILQSAIAEGIARGIVRPLNRVVYSPADVSRAFRLLPSTGCSVRVLINLENLEIQDQIALPTTTHLNGTHVVISDDSDLGIEVVDRLISKGAKNVLLHCTKQSGYLRYKLHAWNNSGVFVLVLWDVLRDEDSCTKLIKNASKGSIHGIFIIHKVSNQIYEDFSKINYDNPDISIVHHLDNASRKLCPELRTFVVIALNSIDNKKCCSLFEQKKICETRRQRGLPSVVFEIGLNKEQMENIDNLLLNTNRKNLSTVFMSLESAIENNKDVSFILSNKQLSIDFEQKITKILGIKNIDAYDGTTTLKNLGISYLQLQEIKALIYTAYGMNYPLESVQQMTIQSLLMLCDKYVKTEVKTGLDALFSYVELDEYTDFQPFMFMPSVYNNSYIIDKNIDIDSHATNLFMVPGFEGHHQVFTTICSGLKIQAVTIQTDFIFQEDNISETAKRIMRNIKQEFHIKTKFYLLGYSYGVNVALELASLMENEGHTGIVICLGSSPDAIKIQVDEYVGKMNGEDLENEIIKHMYFLFSGRVKDDLEPEITNLHAWSDKIEFCIKKLKSFVQHPHEYMKYTIQGFYNKIKAVRDYKPNYKLQSELVLLKGPQKMYKALAEDYGLGKYTLQPVRVFNVENDFASIPQDYRVSCVVNKLIEPRILEEFKQKHL